TVAGAIVTPGKTVVEQPRVRRRQAATRVGHTGEDIRDRIARLQAAEERDDDGSDVVEPWHRDRRAGIDDDDRSGIRRSDPRNEFVLGTGQLDARPVLTFGLPL